MGKINEKHTSELCSALSAERFKKIFIEFMNQADKNFVTGLANGGQTPYGYSKKPRYDGADLCTHYGQGAAGKTPYLNWWVVSIYYLPENENVVLGIEENRYPHLKEMQIKPLRYSRIGNKKVDMAVFYATTKSKLNYDELYEVFINVSEEVMRLGLK